MNKSNQGCKTTKYRKSDVLSVLYGCTVCSKTSYTSYAVSTFVHAACLTCPVDQQEA